MTDYKLGHRPRWTMTVDGSAVWTNGIPVDQQPESSWHKGEAAINRIDVELGIDMIHTCTFNLVGKDAAKVAKSLFPRRSELSVSMGYEEDSDEMFRGTVMQGFPGPSHPVTIEIAADSPMYQVRERWVEETENVDSVGEMLANLITNDTELELGFGEWRDAVAEEGGTVSGNMLENLNNWIAANGMHYLDTMGGDILLLYPHGITGDDIYLFAPGHRKRRWELPYSARPDEPELAAILKSWAPVINYVDAPSKITAAWGYYEDGSDDITVEPIEATVENGLEDTVLDLGIIRTATKEQAQFIVDAWAKDRDWLAVEGTFELATGVPIRPLDTIVARGGPEGLEEFFDKEMVVTRVHHTMDERGWTTRGRVRGLIKP